VIILGMEQGSPEWFSARLGRPTAGSFQKLITTKGMRSDQAKKYINELAAERLSGERAVGFQSAHMKRGNMIEPVARAAYEFETDSEVMEVGFIVDKSFEFGCSPDGLIGDSGGLEIKCPAANTMIGYYENPQSLVTAYYQQIQGCIWVSQREWWDVFAYHPTMSRPVLVRVEKDNEFIKKLSDEVDSAVTEIKKLVELYK
tara:strand:+ start:1800 stop:2402 length:603 start_codon:yes stop_codon:yes gene_type:complete